ncbi:MAG: FAD-dependent oxidoreductase [Nitrospiraceae bacterium]|nr:FAD-dependent oxidoreductase [Nitrospiraceae bacterium]
MKKNIVLIPPDSRKVLQEEFSQLQSPVGILIFTDEKKEDPFSDFAAGLVRELGEITDKIVPIYETLDSELAKKHHVSRSPTLLVQPEKYDIRFTGAPAGEEVKTLIITILMSSTGNTVLSDDSRTRLAALKEKRAVRVFVSPTCPYCPQQAAYAVAAAIERPGMVTAEMVEIFENKDIAAQFNVVSVPQTFINDQLVAPGLQPEEVFIQEVLSAAPVEARPAEVHEGIEKDLVIIGAGPAGLTAAMYAERSGLKAIVIEKANIGGQVALTPVVENYPAFSRIAGKTLMDMMAQQAVMYTDIHQGEEVIEVKRADGRFDIATTRGRYSAKTVLITTGAESKKLGAPGEREFQGRGVSYCAACDGYFFKDGKKAIVVGGGNTAATEALYLKNIGVDVTLVHRRGELRAEQFLRQSLSDNKIPIIWNTVVKEIRGDKLVYEVVLEDIAGGSVTSMKVGGVFVAIGYVPNNELAKKLGVATDREGYIIIDKAHRTNVPGIYAAGDITGGIKQIVTAVGQGAVAAMTIFEDTAHPYWKEKSGS